MENKNTIRENYLRAFIESNRKTKKQVDTVESFYKREKLYCKDCEEKPTDEELIKTYDTI